MAMLSGNSPLQGIRGSIGELVFRSFGGKTVVSARPERSRFSEQSERQRRCRARFKDASLHVKKMLCDPAKKELYRKKAKELNLPNAYTAAVKEYMRKTTIESINTIQHTAKAGEDSAIDTSSKATSNKDKQEQSFVTAIEKLSSVKCFYKLTLTERLKTLPSSGPHTGWKVGEVILPSNRFSDLACRASNRFSTLRMMLPKPNLRSTIAAQNQKFGTLLPGYRVLLL